MFLLESSKGTSFDRKPYFISFCCVCYMPWNHCSSLKLTYIFRSTFTNGSKAHGVTLVRFAFQQASPQSWITINSFHPYFSLFLSPVLSHLFWVLIRVWVCSCCDVRCGLMSERKNLVRLPMWLGETRHIEENNMMLPSRPGAPNRRKNMLYMIEDLESWVTDFKKKKIEANPFTSARYPGCEVPAVYIGISPS